MTDSTNADSTNALRDKEIENIRGRLRDKDNM